MYPPVEADPVEAPVEDPSLDPTLSGPTPEEIQIEQDKAKVEAQTKEDEINDILLDLLKEAEKEDEDLRVTSLGHCKRNNLYFNNIQAIFYDDVARDVKKLDSVLKDFEGSGLDDLKIINVYRAFAESLIAAETISAPATEFTPDDTDNPDDVETAEAFSRIAILVSRHNHAPLMLIKAATLQFNSGTIFGFNYYKTDPSFGVVKTPGRTEQKSKTLLDIRCPQCSELLDSGVAEGLDPAKTVVSCPYCQYQGPPHVYARLEYFDEVVEYENTPKGRAEFDIFDMTNVKVPIYARKQEKCGYLVLRLEEHISALRSVYKDFYDDIKGGGGDSVKYERWARLPIEYQGTFPKDLNTLRSAWFRPSYYHTLDDEEDVDKLIAEYPDGVMISVIDDTIVEKKHEKLDDRWTIAFDPRSNFIHSEPPGNALIPLQDSQTDIFNLGIQSIEYGITETFANPKTLNFKKYKETRNIPGMVTPATPPGPDKSISDGFYQTKAAVLSSEYTTFAASLTPLTQFVTGAFPSIFGGSASGEQTATEYTESKSRALQRLQLPWQMISVFWTSLIYKCTKDFATNLLEDEHYTDKKNGTHINVWILKSSMQGKVGHMQPEINGQLPQSWSQKKDFFMQLVGMQNPEIGSIVLHPNNAENLKLVTGMPEFYIPGEEDRTKQWIEYYELAQGQENTPQPGMQDPTQPPQGPQSSVPIDLDVDDHGIHMAVLKGILVSDIGRMLYKTNPAAYQNCIAHYREHEMAQQAKTVAPSGTTQAGEPAESAAKTTQG